MTQKRIILKGYYECEGCGSIYEVDGEGHGGDGYCDCCKNDEGDLLPLTYLGKELPKNIKENLIE
jgi:hypothetical protein